MHERTVDPEGHPPASGECSSQLLQTTSQRLAAVSNDCNLGHEGKSVLLAGPRRRSGSVGRTLDSAAQEWINQLVARSPGAQNQRIRTDPEHPHPPVA